MPGAVFLVVDTNLFHECLSLEASDFPWSDLGDFDTIELIVSDPVQSELDEQKKDTRPRVKKRAVQAVTWFRDMLRNGTREHIFRQQNPRVVMRVTAQTASTEFAELLDLTVNDDKIVGVAAALAKAAPERDIRVISHDTRPVTKADAVGLSFNFIPDSWIREPEADDNEKENARLRAEIASLRASNPALEVAAIGAVERRLSLTREVLSHPSKTEIDEIRVRLGEKFSFDSIEQKFSKRLAFGRATASSLRGGTQYIPPTESELTHYRDEVYPAWLDACADHVASLTSTLNSRIAASTVTVTLSNSGFRPAENVIISFIARGPLLIAPRRDEGYDPKLEGLPKLPRPPIGRWLHEGWPMAQASALMDPGREYNALDLARLGGAHFEREDESWYFEPERPTEPVVSYELACRRFRHGNNLRHFNLSIFSQSEDASIRGALDVEVSASNVGQSLRATFPIEIKSTYKSPWPDLERFLSSADIT